MRFWDTSALVPLLMREPATADVQRELASDEAIIVWWGTEVECTSALSRFERGGTDIADGLQRLDALAQAWLQIEPTDRVRSIATRLLRVHPLRAADALRLAAASVASEGDSSSLPFVTFDARLGQAAFREGHPVISPGGRK